MAFQINEKMMAHDRAIITRNKTERDLMKDDVIRFKPGMAHYISENQKLFLSVEPKKLPNNSIRKFLEVITDVRLSQILLDYVNRDGGSNNSMRGPLHSVVTTGTSPFVIASTTKVANLNVDRVDDMHVSVSTANNTIVGRDASGNINVNTIINFNKDKIENTSTGLYLKKKDGSGYTDLSVATINSSTGILKANNTSTKGVIEWKNNVWNVGAEGKTSEIVTKSLYGHGKGINADMVDNRHVDDSQISTSYLWTSKKIDDSKAPRGFGLGTDINSIPNNDCNAISGTGFFSGTTPANGVANETGVAMIQSYIASGKQFQIIEYTVSKKIYTRYKVDNTWTTWNKVMTKIDVSDEVVHIVLSSSEPAKTNNEDTYWYEIL
jgi:hypothetical protein|nr:MAG TPA: hypothetical protein [Caudoviricetes sp.]